MANFVCPPPYIFTLHGILNIIEMILSILTFAISFGGGFWWNQDGGGWVEFVGIISLILIGIILILHILNIVPAFFINYHIELIVYIALAIMFMIAGIVAAAKAYNDSVKACSFFAFATMLTLMVDIGFRIFRGMQSRNDLPSSSQPQSQPPVNQVPAEYTSSNAVY